MDETEIFIFPKKASRHLVVCVITHHYHHTPLGFEKLGSEIRPRECVTLLFVSGIHHVVGHWLINDEHHDNMIHD